MTAVRHGMLLDQLPAVLPITAEHHLVDKAVFRQRFHDLPEVHVRADFVVFENTSTNAP